MEYTNLLSTNNHFAKTLFSKKLLISVLMFTFFWVISISGAELPGIPVIKGAIVDKSTNQPLEYVNVTLKNGKDSIITGCITDKNGDFSFVNLKPGQYILSYSFVGYDKIDSISFEINAAHPKINFGRLYISENSRALNQINVVGQRSTFVNSIDRKTFNVGQDLSAKAGSVSDLMENIPSVQVDIDGVVSLRGSSNVTILINGRPSAMMKISPADALKQMSASSVEKVEIITNPSAKYKPDGTSGIINIILKKNKTLGFNGIVTANIGNMNRRNLNFTLNYNPGKLNIYGSLGIRTDNRSRINTILSTSYDSLFVPEYSNTYSVGNGNRISYLAMGGIDYKINNKNNLGVSVSCNYRYQLQNDTSNYVLKDFSQQTLTDYDRDRRLPEKETDLEFNANYQHLFDNDGHELNINWVSSISHENEDNYYSNHYKIPSTLITYDNMFYHHLNSESEFLVEYVRPLTDKSELEAGFIQQYFKNDMDLRRDTADQSLNWYNDLTRSNHFIRTENTDVLYVTYKQELGKFGFLGGLRAEQTLTNANLVTLDSTINIHYYRLYPSLHISYNLTDVHQLQLNYSHRIHRPDDEDLNPFPEYQDLKNIRAGNPYLKPEDTHSFEFGYQLKKNETTFLSTIYYRNSYNKITSTIQKLSNDTYLTTLQNLSQSKDAGLELILSSTIGKFLNFNLSSNTFYNTIDASSLGYNTQKSNFAFSASGYVSLNLTKTTLWQITSNYRAKTLTPQGYRLPNFVVNSGIKQDLFNKKATLVLSVSDIFNSLKYATVIDMPNLQRIETRTRSSQTFYLGFIYSFGNSDKKSKENAIKYDNQI